MPSPHSITIQVAGSSLNPVSPGHMAIVVNSPDKQTYAGFGPRDSSLRSLFGSYSPPQFNVQNVSPGTTPLPHDYATVFDHPSYRTFTVPVSDDQANAARVEIERIRRTPPQNYNAYGGNVCTTIASQILRAAGLGGDNPMLPDRVLKQLSDISDTLAREPDAVLSNDDGYPIPPAMRGLQQDYAYVGSGFDTPSELMSGSRTRRVSGLTDDINGEPGRSIQQTPGTLNRAAQLAGLRDGGVALGQPTPFPSPVGRADFDRLPAVLRGIDMGPGVDSGATTEDWFRDYLRSGAGRRSVTDRF